MIKNHKKKINANVKNNIKNFKEYLNKNSYLDINEQ